MMVGYVILWAFLATAAFVLALGWALLEQAERQRLERDVDYWKGLALRDADDLPPSSVPRRWG